MPAAFVLDGDGVIVRAFYGDDSRVLPEAVERMLRAEPGAGGP